MRNTLICTVGTSLFGNLKHLGKKYPDHPAYQAFLAQDWARVALDLLKEAPTERLCGAEINSITSIVNSGYVRPLLHLVFLVSDTNDAIAVGEVLKHYYNHKTNPIQFAEVPEPRILTGLNDESVERFQQEGLKSLVSAISDVVRGHDPEYTAINATGGYKAQISFAGMIGQALEIPVYYLFERFSKAIELPPQPVSLDLTLWLTHYPLLEQLDTDEPILKTAVTIDDGIEVLAALIDEVEVDGKRYLDLSAMGKLFHERCQLQFKKSAKDLLAQIATTTIPVTEKTISLREDHGHDVLLAFSNKINKSPYVERIVNSLPFNPHQRTPIRQVKENGLIEFVLTWTDPGLGICIQSTARNKRDAAIIARMLEEEYVQ